jgi:hypothetical protein
VQHVSGAPLIRGLGYLDPCHATIPGLQRTTFVALAQVIIAFPGRGAAREWCTADPGSWVSRSLPCDDPGSAAHRFALRRARETVSGGSAPTTLYALVGLRDITMSVTLLSPEGWQCSQESAPNGANRAAGLSALRLGFGWRGALLPGRAASLTFRLPERGCRSKAKLPNRLCCCCRSIPPGARPASSGGGAIRSGFSFCR